VTFFYKENILISQKLQLHLAFAPASIKIHHTYSQPRKKKKMREKEIKKHYNHSNLDECDAGIRVTRRLRIV
jgi:hypothetical protein